ncbi:MAG: beta-mannosidase [Lachnospiraceae bacterium]|nr:beta-mannosidase [Lachnospiraceae bacterium]
MALCTLGLAACGKGSDSKVEPTPTEAANAEVTPSGAEEAEPTPEASTGGEDAAPTAIPVVTAEPVIYEAEKGTLTGNARIESSKNGFRGEGYVTGFEADGDACTITVNAEQTGFYDLHIVSFSTGDTKENYIHIDGEQFGTFKNTKSSFENVVVERVYLEEGQHEITISKYWGWIGVDSITLKGSAALPEDLYEVSAKLINENATDNAKRLMSYLTDIYGKQYLTGQSSDAGMYGMERSAIWKTTGGEFPAILGLDLIEYTPSRVANGSTSKAVEYAIDYWDAGGIVTFCWHWNAPEEYLTGVWYSGFYKEHTNINLAKIMSGEDTAGYDLLIRDIDAIAEQLKKLQDADVPVLWRPLHEASGGWFWWGASGAEAYKELYKLLYDRLTNHHGLNNLIWVWNGQSADWYPGDEYVDIIGEDIYPGEKVYTSQVKKFLEAAGYSVERKMVVMSENGCLFDPDLAIRDGAMWGYYTTWGGECVLKDASLNILSEQYTEAEMVKKVYSHEAAINFSELPDLKTYPIHE